VIDVVNYSQKKNRTMVIERPPDVGRPIKTDGGTPVAQQAAAAAAEAAAAAAAESVANATIADAESGASATIPGVANANNEAQTEGKSEGRIEGRLVANRAVGKHISRGEESQVAESQNSHSQKLQIKQSETSQSETSQFPQQQIKQSETSQFPQIQKHIRLFPESEFADRVKRARQLMTEANIDALVVTTEQDFFYFSGLDSPFWQSPTREMYLVIGREEVIESRFNEKMTREMYNNNIGGREGRGEMFNNNIEVKD
jgi:hypothetical protein